MRTALNVATPNSNATYQAYTANLADHHRHNTANTSLDALARTFTMPYSNFLTRFHQNPNLNKKLLNQSSTPKNLLQSSITDSSLKSQKSVIHERALLVWFF
jgi:hypothetical protein